jgi:RHS repeat-associated protein
MTNDGGSWTYTWDGENRLIVAEKTGQRLEFKYDYLNRRIEKRVLDGGTESKKERFVYNIWSNIEILDGRDSNNILKKFVIDGDTILSMTNNNGTYYYTADTIGNISEILDSTGTIRAHYEYSPFGKTILQTGDLADENPFKFSSEYLDLETGLTMYMFRFYNSELGKWISRDPVEEEGGANLYGFVYNNSINNFDYLGLECKSVETKNEIKEEGQCKYKSTGKLIGGTVKIDTIQIKVKNEKGTMHVVDAHVYQAKYRIKGEKKIKYYKEKLRYDCNLKKIVVEKGSLIREVTEDCSKEELYTWTSAGYPGLTPPPAPIDGPPFRIKDIVTGRYADDIRDALSQSNLQRLKTAQAEQFMDDDTNINIVVQDNDFQTGFHPPPPSRW